MDMCSFAPGRQLRRREYLCLLAAVVMLSVSMARPHLVRADDSDDTPSDSNTPSLSGEQHEHHDEAPGMMGPLVAIDASPGNSIVPFAPHWVRSTDGRTLGFGFGVDKMLSENADIEVDGTFDSNSPKGGSKETGLGDVDVLSRYLLVNQPDLLLAVVPEATVSVGTFGETAGLDDAGLAFAWAGRGGALPEDWNLGYLRALELHSDIGYSRILSNGSGDEIFVDPVVDYSMPYLQYLTKKEIPWPVSNLCFFAEINFDEVVDGSDSGPPTFYATPGVSYLTDTYQVTLGAQLPLNHAADHQQHLALLGEVSFALDGLPVVGWMPF